MYFLQLCNKAIPGYDLFEEEKAKFEKSQIGMKFIKKVNEYLIRINKLEDNHSSVSSGVNKENSKNNLIADFLKSVKRILNHEDTRKLMHEIQFPMLKLFLPEASQLSDEQHKQLTKAAFSKSLLTARVLQNQQIKKEEYYKSCWFNYPSIEESIKVIKKKLSDIESSWMKNLEDSSEKTIIKIKNVLLDVREKKINEFQRQRECKKMVRHYRIKNKIKKIKKSLQVISTFDYRHGLDSNINNAINKYLVNMDQSQLEYLLKIIFSHYISSILISIMDIEPFKEIHSNFGSKLVAYIFKSINTDTKIDLIPWEDEYKKALFNVMEKELTTINGRLWKPLKPAQSKERPNSLSYLFSKTGTEKGNRNFFDKMANNHMFFEFVGLTNTNGNFFLGFIDIYNYYRHREVVEEQRKIINAFLIPFQPIYFEYQKTAYHEKNIYLKIAKMMLPILIAAAFTILMSYFLSQLIVVESVFVIALIPTIYLGLFVAAEYVKLKNYLVDNLYTYWYGGKFEVPEFKVNERMEKIFPKTNAVKAEDIKALYIKEFKKCARLEAELSPSEKMGTLFEKDRLELSESIQTGEELTCEWHDIHNNVELVCDFVPEIVLERVKKIETAQYKQYHEELKDSVFPALKKELETRTNFCTNSCKTFPEKKSLNSFKSEYFSFFGSNKAEKMKSELDQTDELRLSLSKT